MKIGIITYHCAHNYGAVLQAYALQCYLQEAGHSVTVVNYRPDFLVQPYTLFRWSWPVGVSVLQCCRRVAGVVWYGFRFLPSRWLRRWRFEHFISGQLNLSPQVRRPEEVTALGFDALVFGSDQIWNIGNSDGPDPFYFGAFPDFSGVKIAYAASADGGEEAMLHHADCLEYIRDYASISARERSLATALHAVVGREVDTVVDPTLLLEPTQWEALATDPGRRRYVLVYEVLPCSFIVELAEHIARELGLSVVIMRKDIAPHGRPGQSIDCAAPKEFLGWVQNADYVVTSSFHGTVFSVLNRKPFVCALSGLPAENRMLGLLEELGMAGRRCYDAHPPDDYSYAVDYAPATERIVDLRRKSRDFLRHACARLTVHAKPSGSRL